MKTLIVPTATGLIPAFVVEDLMGTESLVKVCPLKSNNFFKYCLIRVLLTFVVRETLCDLYIMCPEAHRVSV